MASSAPAAPSSTPPARRRAPVPTVTLNSTHEMPLVGLGTWQAPVGVVGAAVADAISRRGYAHVDCAAAYANEEEVGDALRDAMASGAIARESLFVTSKLWNDRRRPRDVRAGLEQTLRDLKLDYLDLYLIHWPVVWRRGTLMQRDGDASIAECWRALEALVDEGKSRSIGVSNFDEAQLEELMRTARIAPAVNQIERHPKLPQDALVRYCQERGIVVTAYSPLARGGALFADPVVSDIAEKHSVAPAQVLLRWSVQRGVVVVPKSVTQSRIEANADLWGFELDASDVEALSTLEDGESVVASPWGTKQKKNVVLRPLLTAIMWPVSKIVRVDVQRMGRSGFWRWAWSEGE